MTLEFLLVVWRWKLRKSLNMLYGAASGIASAEELESTKPRHYGI